MDILSLKYIAFIFITSLFYWILNDKYRNILLIIFSAIFIASFGINNLLLTSLYIAFSFFYTKKCKNRFMLIVGIIILIVPLFVNKYLNDLIVLLNNILNSNISSISFSFVGISYTCFKAISYLVDSYKGKLVNISLQDYIIYMMFFPSFLSGPIEKTKSFTEQINKKKEFNEKNMIEALFIIVFGFFMKKVVADRLIILINYFYSDSSAYGFLTIIAILAYSIYIYCDFCGYSYISLGVGKIFGFELINNFKQPYLSLSVRNFWNNWHISLNDWLRDYIYIPLGGNRKGLIRKYINILIVFIVSGIWHGSGLGFIIWGALNAIYQIIGDLTLNTRNKIYKASKLENTVIQTIIKTACVFILLSISWVFFSQGFDGALYVFRSIFAMPTLTLSEIIEGLIQSGFFNKLKFGLIMLGLSILLIFIVDLRLSKNKKYIIADKKVLNYLLLAFVVIVIIMFGSFNDDNGLAKFIYFNF